MSKPKLIYRELDYPNFNQGHVKPWVEAWFDLIAWEPNMTVPTDCFFMATYQQDFDPNAWFRPYEQDGYHIVIDHLYDSDVETTSQRLHDRKLQLRSPHWMWYSSALLNHFAGYRNYRPNRAYTHDFLCLMNKVRDHRDRVMNELKDQLTTARWSYVDRGIEIGDSNERLTPIFWEFYMNPQWYDSTCWHLVVESWVRSDVWFASPQPPNYRTEISEKSYKPLAFFQPFVLIGSVDTLAFLKRQGFETFDNLWSEQYDTISKDDDRVTAVLDQVKDIVLTHNRRSPGWDRLTEQKLLHNHHQFFDVVAVKRRFDQEIIVPIQEFLSQ